MTESHTAAAVTLRGEQLDAVVSALTALSKIRVASYDAAAKRRFTAAAVKVANAVAAMLELEVSDASPLPAGATRIKTSLGGPAVGGDVYLHGHNFWLCITGNETRAPTVFYRRPLNSANSVRWDDDGANRVVNLTLKGESLVTAVSQMRALAGRWNA